MGILSSGDLFNQATDRIIEGMENIVKEVDDVLLFSDTLEGVAENLEEMLQRFEDNNVTLAPKKFQFGSEVIFAGMKITKDGCSPDPDRMTAVEQFPRPSQGLKCGSCWVSPNNSSSGRRTWRPQQLASGASCVTTLHSCGPQSVRPSSSKSSQCWPMSGSSSPSTQTWTPSC